MKGGIGIPVLRGIPEGMDFKLIGDSSLEFTDEIRNFIETESIPLSMTLGEKQFVDDDKLDVDDFVRQMCEFNGAARSSCPPPQTYRNAFECGKPCFCITLSSKISGSYASAKTGHSLMHEGAEHVHVIDSKSASAGQLLIAYKIKELIEKGLTEQEIVVAVTEFIDSMKTMFVLESIDNFVKNGRVSKIKGIASSLLNLHPIMGSDNGDIICQAKVRGLSAAQEKMCNLIANFCKDTKDRLLVIAHCQNEAGAKRIAELAEKLYSFKRIIIQKTNGLSSMYANRGGIVIAF